jgi:hypothetical protein
MQTTFLISVIQHFDHKGHLKIILIPRINNIIFSTFSTLTWYKNVCVFYFINKFYVIKFGVVLILSGPAFGYNCPLLVLYSKNW